MWYYKIAKWWIYKQINRPSLAFLTRVINVTEVMVRYLNLILTKSLVSHHRRGIIYLQFEENGWLNSLDYSAPIPNPRIFSDSRQNHFRVCR